MKALYAALILPTPVNAADPIKTEVTLPIDDQHKPNLLEKARAKAVYQAADKLPTVIWGSEYSVNGNYREEIKAIGPAYASVTVAQERYDYLANTYTLIADVAFEHNTIMTTLDMVKDGVRASKTLHKLTELLKALKLEDFVSNKMLDT
jgi:hypothetical protein